MDSSSAAKLPLLLEQARIAVAERTPSQARIAYSEAWSIAIQIGDEEAAVEIAEMMAGIEPMKVRMGWIEKGIELALTAKTEGPRKRLPSLYLARGYDHLELRRFSEAIEAFSLSSDQAKILGERKAELRAEVAKGKTLRAMLKLDEALKLQMGLLEESDRLGERHGEIYEEIAECLHALKRTEESEKYFALAYQELSAEMSPDDRRPNMLKRLKTLGKVKSS